MRYRSRIEIASRILELPTGGATDQDNAQGILSYAQLKEYLAVLEAMGCSHRTGREDLQYHTEGLTLS